MTQAPGLEASARVVRSVTAVTDSLSARHGRGRRQFLARTFQTALVFTTGVGKRSDTEEKEVGFKERP